MASQTRSSRLPRSFHRTFMPERQYMGRLLQHAAGSGAFDMQAIADQTGIPTGTSSGKVMPTADYCIGMGLVRATGTAKAARLELTPFGRTVLLEDKFLREPLTQWLAHLNLCDRIAGAEVWHQTFWASTSVLGDKFTRTELNDWLCDTMKIARQNVLGPTIRMYEDDGSFAACGAIRSVGDMIQRRRPPLAAAHAFGHAAWLASAIERAGRGGMQATMDDLEAFCGLRSATGWSLAESQEMLALIEQKGLASVDRHMRPWIVCIKHSAESLWRRLYEDFV